MSGKSPPSLYDVLGLNPGASDQDVRQAWRRLAQQHHPDRGDAADSEAMALINQAYEVLSDRQRRARYDHGRQPPGEPRRPGRVTLPGDRLRLRLLWAATALLLVAVGAGFLARYPLDRGTAAGSSPAQRADGPAGVGPRPGQPAAAAALPIRDADPAADAPLRLIPASRLEARSFPSPQPQTAHAEDTVARQP
ncbi:J domain-containing protein [Ramlibacter tataouinensis]|uniref:J domain-containing protein n=1 Tax=Ramlibacter tataouinensis TaxID=94132 RepID=UPI0022F3A5B2|nr:J domain-containing protein [Ramlibacter tataouinensis]WBY02303.1 J domain-containing protein [Ramlibacter tataouinensis]